VLVDVALGEPPEPVVVDETDELGEPPLPFVVVDVVVVDMGGGVKGVPLSEQAAAEAVNETQSRRSARLVMLISSRAEPAQADLVAARPVRGSDFFRVVAATRGSDPELEV
jgi:hypothetical protein